MSICCFVFTLFGASSSVFTSRASTSLPVEFFRALKRALSRKIPTAIFLLHYSHPIHLRPRRFPFQFPLLILLLVSFVAPRSLLLRQTFLLISANVTLDMCNPPTGFATIVPYYDYVMHTRRALPFRHLPAR